MQYVTLSVENNQLTITLTTSGREFLEDVGGENKSTDDLLWELLEYPLCNGWRRIDPPECGALTEAPIITNDWSEDNDGKLTHLGTIYAYMNYQVFDPVAEMKKNGHVIWPGF